jgi:enoyl-CoA hydratase/carnithine racemase
VAHESLSSLPRGGSSLGATRRGEVLLLQLNSPDGFPRLTRAVLLELRSQIEMFVESPDLRGAVISGSEKCFCAGAELNEVAELNGVEAMGFSALGQSVMATIEKSAKPIVAAVSGYCMGGGFDLALACQIRIATANTIFAHRGATLGIITGWGGTQRLPRMIGPRGKSVAHEIMTTGREVPATEAFDLRLISRIVPSEKLLDEACALAVAGSKLQSWLNASRPEGFE